VPSGTSKKQPRGDAKCFLEDDPASIITRFFDTDFVHSEYQRIHYQACSHDITPAGAFGAETFGGEMFCNLDEIMASVVEGGKRRWQ
jgi:hypothetical protein